MFKDNPLTLAYSLRHLRERKVQTFMTVGGIALVVFVFTATLMLARGLQETLQATGSYDHAIAIMTGAQNEVESGISRENAGVIVTQPETARTGQGQSLATTDLVVLVTLKKRGSSQTSNVAVRGITPQAWNLRPEARLVAGRPFQPGTREIIAGRAVNGKFASTDLGQSIRLVGADWKVVGLFDAGNTAFNSEIWGDVDILLPSFRRDQFSSVTLKLKNGADFRALKERLEKDPRLGVRLQREVEFYQSQSRDLGTFIRYLGGFVSIIFSLGAVIGAMVTMYSAVAVRVREIGILRALGFSRTSIFAAFVKECLLIGLIGGAAGILLASALSFVTFATANFTTFADLSFGFKLTVRIAAAGLGFALLMGFLGGALPALRAARLQIVSALRTE